MDRVLVDTSAWFAFANRGDRQHRIVGEFVQDYQGRLVTSNFIFDETVSLCRFRLGHGAAAVVGAALMDPGEVDLIRITAEDESAAWQLFCDRADQRYSFTDCTSFALMRRLGLTTALALDGDFRTEGFILVP